MKSQVDLPGEATEQNINTKSSMITTLLYKVRCILFFLQMSDFDFISEINLPRKVIYYSLMIIPYFLATDFL